MSRRYKAGILSASFDPLVDHGGVLYTWGNGSDGKLGNTSVSRSTPGQVGDSYWSSVATGTGRLHAGAIRNDGALFLWGYNYIGELGIGSAYPSSPYTRSSPVQIGTTTDWSKLVTGYENSGAIKTNGTLWMWGKNTKGNLGDNTRVHRSSPVQVGSSTDWAYLSIGRADTAVITTSGFLWGFGENSYGVFFDTWPVYSSPRSSPIQIGSDTWTQVVLGSTGVFAGIKSNGLLFTAGHNTYGKLGINLTYGGSNNARSSPVQIGSSTWSHVSIAPPTVGGHLLAIQTNGTLWSWGRNNSGQLGHNDTIVKSSPTQVGALTNWYRTAAGAYFSVGSKTDGTLWAWGYNGDGINGNGIVYSTKSSPIQVGTDTNWSLFNTTYSSVYGLREF
jgi:alpha-tubulin suppressor-like RCC1 family protein